MTTVWPAVNKKIRVHLEDKYKLDKNKLEELKNVPIDGYVSYAYQNEKYSLSKITELVYPLCIKTTILTHLS